MLTFDETQGVLDKIVKALATLCIPDEIPNASKALQWAFQGCMIQDCFLEVLQYRVWLASWGSMKIEKLPAEDSPPPVKGPGVYLKLISSHDGREIKFHFGPYTTPIRVIMD